MQPTSPSTLANKVLTVTGSQMVQGREACEILASEYETGIYQRSFALSRDLDDSAVKARLRDGVLEKSSCRRPRRRSRGGLPSRPDQIPTTFRQVAAINACPATEGCTPSPAQKSGVVPAATASSNISWNGTQSAPA